MSDGWRCQVSRSEISEEEWTIMHKATSGPKEDRVTFSNFAKVPPPGYRFLPFFPFRLLFLRLSFGCPFLALFPRERGRHCVEFSASALPDDTFLLPLLFLSLFFS